MADFNGEIEIEPWEYVSTCSKQEIQELIESLVEEGYLDKNLRIKRPNVMMGVLEEEFVEKLNSLSTKYYSMTEDELTMIDKLYNNYK